MRCTNHPNNNAFSFCFSCGNWYCNECLIQRGSQPLCIDCANYSKKETVSNIIGIFDIKKIGFSLKMLSSALLVVWITLGLVIHPFFYFLSLTSIITFSISFLLKNQEKIRLNKNYLKITNAQVFALLNRYNKITFKKLADSTNSTEEASKKKLNQMVLDNILEISTEDVNLIYTKKA